MEDKSFSSDSSDLEPLECVICEETIEDEDLDDKAVLCAICVEKAIHIECMNENDEEDWYEHLEWVCETCHKILSEYEKEKVKKFSGLTNKELDEFESEKDRCWCRNCEDRKIRSRM